MEGLQEIAKNTNNDAIILVIVLIIGIAVVAIPLYKVLINAQEKKRQQYMEREQILVDVVKENSEIMAGLKVVLESTYSNCSACKAEQVDLFHQITKKQDRQIELLTEVHTIVQFNAKIDKHA